MTVEARVDPDRAYTVEEFMALPDDGRRYELVGGKLEPMTPTSGEHGIIAARLHVELGYHVRKNELGDTYIAEAAFVIDPSGDVRAPDIGFVAAARAVPAGRGPVPIPPDLTVEVISPSDMLVKVAAKVQAYLEAGVRLIWVVNPRNRTVRVYRQGMDGYATLSASDHLDGEDVVPGFSLPIASLFV